MKKILLADDDFSSLIRIKDILSKRGFKVLIAENNQQAFNILKKNDIFVVICERLSRSIDSHKILRFIKLNNLTSELLITSQEIEFHELTDIMRKGVYDFFKKPIDIKRLIGIINKLIELEKNHLKTEELKKELGLKYNFNNIIAESRAMRDIISKIKTIADTNASVLLMGESGTGKEVISRAIHYNSYRKERPFIAVNCSAIPENLIESELFGHEKGAFTGAIKQRIGKFELADNSTLFLDEIGDLRPHLQAKLLRAIEENEIERIGSETKISINTRIISATNIDLSEQIKKGNFRSDLYYRIAGITINIPPLRERKEDIAGLVKLFIDQSSIENKKNIKGITPEALELLKEYPWPGNIRELKNIINEMVIFSNNNMLNSNDIPIKIKGNSVKKNDFLKPGITIKEANKILIERTLELYKWNKAKAAEVLGISSRTLYRWLKKQRA